MSMSSARLRKTFAYPTEDVGDDDTPEAMDEEGQQVPVEVSS